MGGPTSWFGTVSAVSSGRGSLSQKSTGHTPSLSFPPPLTSHASFDQEYESGCTPTLSIHPVPGSLPLPFGSPFRLRLTTDHPRATQALQIADPAGNDDDDDDRGSFSQRTIVVTAGGRCSPRNPEPPTTRALCILLAGAVYSTKAVSMGQAEEGSGARPGVAASRSRNSFDCTHVLGQLLASR